MNGFDLGTNRLDEQNVFCQDQRCIDYQEGCIHICGIHSTAVNLKEKLSMTDILNFSQKHYSIGNSKGLCSFITTF